MQEPLLLVRRHLAAPVCPPRPQAPVYRQRHRPRHRHGCPPAVDLGCQPRPQLPRLQGQPLQRPEARCRRLELVLALLPQRLRRARLAWLGQALLLLVPLLEQQALGAWPLQMLLHEPRRGLAAVAPHAVRLRVRRQAPLASPVLLQRMLPEHLRHRLAAPG